MTQDLMTPTQPDTRADPVDAPHTADTPATPGDLSVREAVRRAVAELGCDAELDDVLSHLHDTFALCPPRGTVQSYLSLARKDARDGHPNEHRRRGRPKKSNGHAQPQPALDDVIDALEILRDLCERLGDDNVRRLLDAL